MAMLVSRLSGGGGGGDGERGSGTVRSACSRGEAFPPLPTHHAEQGKRRTKLKREEDEEEEEPPFLSFSI